MDFTIRPATPEDAAGIASVNVASWQRAYRGLLPDDYLDTLSADDWTRSWAAGLGSTERRGETLVASAGDDILGFVTVGPLRDNTAVPDDGELQTIYLHPRWWRLGIGRNLHQAALARLRDRGFSTATLWVLVGNERAISFYHQVGWREDGGSRTIAAGSPRVELNELRLRRDLTADGNI